MHLTAQNKTSREDSAFVNTMNRGHGLPIMLTKHGASFLSG